MKEQEKKSNLIKTISYCIVIALCLGFIISTFFFQHTTVHGISMMNTFKDEDVIIFDKISYVFDSPKRYDIVLIKKDENYIVKRIIGMPSDTVQIIDGKIYINDEVINEDYGLDTINEPGIAKDKLTLKDDEYFVLGDNRNYSTDSRDESIGIIKEDEIKGKAVFQLFPIVDMGEIHEDANLNLKKYYEKQSE